MNYVAKRKAERNVVEKYTKTPYRNNQESDFTTEFAGEENPMKGANRNSQKGRAGKHNERPIE